MDTKKHERIKDFLFTWGYKADELNSYIRSIAPDLANGSEKHATNKSMNAIINGFLGRAQTPVKATKIPKPEDLSEKGLAYDLWLMLGFGNDAITLEDLADYMAERAAKIENQNLQEAETDKMRMSNMLRNLNADERIENARFIAEITERAERLRNQNTNMSQLLRDLHTQADSTPHTMRFNDPEATGNPMNTQIRTLNPDSRA